VSCKKRKFVNTTRFGLFLTALLSLSPAVAEEAPAAGVPPANPAVWIPGEVTRSQFTHAVENLEPVDNISVLSNDQTRIVYFTEIHGMAGQTIRHRWEYHGQTVLEVPIKVGTARWRAYSTKTLYPAWIGEWKVSVVDAAGGTLCVNTFSYRKAASEPKLGPPAATRKPTTDSGTPAPQVNQQQ